MVNLNETVANFSLEMEAESLVETSYLFVISVNTGHLAPGGKFTDEEYTQYFVTQGFLLKRLFISMILRNSECQRVRAKCRRLKQEPEIISA